VTSLIAKGKLLPLPEDWAPGPVGFFLYYPSRRQVPAALQVLLDFLRREFAGNVRDD
jgi:DNA-binding transcriptional LysR family regulator